MPGPNADLAGHGIDTQSATNNVPKSLKYYLLGPSLTKAGQELVDQNKVKLSASLFHLAMLIAGVHRSRKSSIMRLRDRSFLTVRKFETRF